MSSEAVFRAESAELVDSPPHLITLLADGSDTGMSFSVIRVDLWPGRDGAAPHVHSGFAELLYVTDGELQVLSGDQISIARTGDLVVVQPGSPHRSAPCPVPRRACWPSSVPASTAFSTSASWQPWPTVPSRHSDRRSREDTTAGWWTAQHGGRHGQADFGRPPFARAGTVACSPALRLTSFSSPGPYRPIRSGEKSAKIC